MPGLWSCFGPVPILAVLPCCILQLKLSLPVTCLQPLAQSPSKSQLVPHGSSSELSPQSFLKLQTCALSTQFRFLHTYWSAPQLEPVGRVWKPNGVVGGSPDREKGRLNANANCTNANTNANANAKANADANSLYFFSWLIQSFTTFFLKQTNK